MLSLVGLLLVLWTTTEAVTVPPSLLTPSPLQFLHVALKMVVVVQDHLNTPEPPQFRLSQV